MWKFKKAALLLYCSGELISPSIISMIWNTHTFSLAKQLNKIIFERHILLFVSLNWCFFFHITQVGKNHTVQYSFGFHIIDGRKSRSEESKHNIKMEQQWVSVRSKESWSPQCVYLFNPSWEYQHAIGRHDITSSEEVQTAFKKLARHCHL